MCRCALVRRGLLWAVPGCLYFVTICRQDAEGRGICRRPGKGRDGWKEGCGPAGQADGEGTAGKRAAKRNGHATGACPQGIS